MGTLHVTVLDEDGKPADAPIYITGSKGGHLGGAQADGSLTFTMPAGVYRVSSAKTVLTSQTDTIKEQYYDRFVSNNAQIAVSAGDTAYLTLTLRKLPDVNQAETYAALQRAGFRNNL